MKKDKFIDKTLLLEAGVEYDLEITKIIIIPDDQDYYVGKDENGLHHLIPARFYSSYDLKTGDTIRCRLDKINCQGRFYFEPEHPVYKKGIYYHFEIVGFLPDENDQNNGYCTALVKDVFGKNLKTEKFNMNPDAPKNLSTLICYVDEIKKAKPVLRVTDPHFVV